MANEEGPPDKAESQKQADPDNEQFLKFFELSTEAMCIADPFGCFKRVNPALTRLTGYSERELITRPFLNFVLAEDRQKTAEEMELQVAVRPSLAFENRYVCKDGTVILLSWNAYFDKDDGVTYATARDITEHRRVEESLAESERKLRLHLQETPVAAIEWDTGFHVTGWNPAAERIFGYSAAEAMGQHASIVIPEATRPLVNTIFADLLTRSGGARSTNENVTKDGRVIVCEWFNTPLTSADGTVTGVMSLGEDVTERVQAERDAQQLARVADAAPSAIMVHDFEGRFFYANQRTFEMYGFSKDEFMTLRLVDLLAPTGMERAAATAQELSVRGKAEFESEHHRKDGTALPLEVQATVTRWMGQVAVLSVATDISERKRAEQALRDSSRGLREAQRLAHIGNWQLSLATGTVTWSEELYRINGLSPELPAPTYPELANYYTPESWTRLSDAVTKALQTGEPYELDLDLVRRDGTIRHTSTKAAATFDANGGIVDLHGTVQDITERKQAEQALRESSQGLREAQRLAHIGSWQWTVATDTVTWSEELYHINGRDPDLPPPSFAEMSTCYTPESWTRLYDAVTRTLQTGEAYELDLDLVRPDGTIRHTSTRADVDRDANGAIVGLYGTVQDVTERRQSEAERERLESELRQSQKLEAVGQLAAGVAHDFNNKLAVILGSSDLAMAALEPTDPVRADIEEIRTAALRSADLTRQLLAFARMQPIAPRELDLNETVESTLSMLRRLTGEGVSLEWVPDPGPCWVRMDPGQIDQVLVNLVVNARDAVSGRGTVRIATRNVELDAEYCSDRVDARPGGYIALEVTDDGCGIDEATLKRVFEPFFTTKPQGQGTGLGLATVHGIAHQNHGFVDIESELAKGTTIRVYLPRDSAEAARANELMPESGHIGRGTVLVVEDEPALLRITARMVEQLGYTVLATHNPNEALRLAAEHVGDIDLLLTDVVMPGMSGAELQRQLAAVRPRLRCLFVSGYPAKVLAETGVLGQGVDLLQKPFAQESLALKLRAVLARG